VHVLVLACVCVRVCVQVIVCVRVRVSQCVVYCDVTQTRMGVQGRFWDASGSTWQAKCTPFRGAVLCRLAARARRQTISAFEPLILLRAPLTNFGWNPRTKCNLRKICRGIDSHQNWKIGKGIPSPRFGAGIGTSRCKNGPEDWSKGRRCWGWVVRQERTTGRKRHPVC